MQNPNTTEWEKDFDSKFDNYHYVAALYAEAQVGDLNMHSLKSFIRSLLLTRDEEVVGKLEAAKMHDFPRMYYTGERDVRAQAFTDAISLIRGTQNDV